MSSRNNSSSFVSPSSANKRFLVRTKLRDRLMSLPQIKSQVELVRRLNQSLTKQRVDPKTSSPPTQRVPPRIPESMPYLESFARQPLSPKGISYIDSYSLDEGSNAQYQGVNGYLEPIGNIYQDYEKKDPLVMKSLQEQAIVRSPTTDQSLPANLKRQLTSPDYNDLSLDTAYERHIRQQERNQEEEDLILHATYDILSESFKELEEELEAEGQSLDDAYQEPSYYEAESAEDFSSRYPNDPLLSDISLVLVSDDSDDH